MVKKGDDWKDLISYLHFRKQHLLLERQKIMYTVREKDREKAYNKLSNKIQEINFTRRVIDGDIKKQSKYEYSKMQHLQKMKIAQLKKKKKITKPIKLIKRKKRKKLSYLDKLLYP